jgi:lipopolysaccharide/colanic/teichoic acid biosynthesis glycosyltransferase
MQAVQTEAGIYGDCHRLFASQRTETRLLPSPYHARKAIIERIAGALLLVLAAVPLAVLFVLVRLSSRGPALFRQLRVGKDGRPFVMYKVRTMRADAEAVTGPVWGLLRDPRATRIGKLLRKLHLDELPQLINVMKGEMSLVGPRPERPEFVPALSEEVAGYADRLAVRPGITGLAQLNLPPDSGLDSVRRKLVLDREYITRANLWLDCRLLACTALRIVKLPEYRLLRWFGLRRTVTLAAAGRDNGSAYPQTGPACPSCAGLIDLLYGADAPHTPSGANGGARSAPADLSPRGVRKPR